MGGGVEEVCGEGAGRKEWEEGRMHELIAGAGWFCVPDTFLLAQNVLK